MKKYIVKINIEAADEAEVKQLGAALQKAVSVVDNKTMMKLLAAVAKKPSLAATASAFV